MAQVRCIFRNAVNQPLDDPSGVPDYDATVEIVGARCLTTDASRSQSMAAEVIAAYICWPAKRASLARLRKDLRHDECAGRQNPKKLVK